MKGEKRAAAFLTAAAVLTVMMAIPSFAATRKKINSINIKIESDVQPDTEYGDENIEIEVHGGKCSYDYYDINNAGFEWTEEDVPEITIYLRADEGYYFALTAASSVKLSGATYVKASKLDSSETLKLVVKLPSLAESVGELTDILIDASGYAVWDPVRGAGSYEVRLYRNGNPIGVTIMSTEDTFYDFREKMYRPGTYYAKVRPVNKIKDERKGKWKESEIISLSSEQAEAIRNGTAPGMPKKGNWKSDDIGWWYEYSDGSMPKNEWKVLDGNWYFFDEMGYMRTGWIEWEGKKYYCAESGELLMNTTTPDGYILGSDGSLKND